MKWSVTWEQTWEKLTKKQFIILSGPRDRCPGTQYRATWETTRVVRRQKTGARDKLGHGLHWGFPGKGKAGQSE